MGLARLRAALAEAASVVATALPTTARRRPTFLRCTRAMFLLQLLKLQRLRGLRRRTSSSSVIVVGFFLDA